MTLFKVILSYGYEFEKTFVFLVIAEDVLEAKEIAINTFKKYDYGDCQLHSIEQIASEGQYAKPNILLISEKLADKTGNNPPD